MSFVRTFGKVVRKWVYNCSEMCVWLKPGIPYIVFPIYSVNKVEYVNN